MISVVLIVVMDVSSRGAGLCISEMSLDFYTQQTLEFTQNYLGRGINIVPNKVDSDCILICLTPSKSWICSDFCLLFVFPHSESESCVVCAGLSATPFRSDLRASALLRTHSNPHLPRLPDPHLPAGAQPGLVRDLDTRVRVSYPLSRIG